MHAFGKRWPQSMRMRAMELRKTGLEYWRIATALGPNGPTEATVRSWLKPPKKRRQNNRRSVSMRPEVWDSLREHCIKHNLSMSAFVEQIVIDSGIKPTSKALAKDKIRQRIEAVSDAAYSGVVML